MRAEARSPHRLSVGRSLQYLGTAWSRALAQRLFDAGWPGEAGFRPGCVGVLLCADRLASGSQKEIGTDLGLDPSDVVGIVDTLEAAGLVARRRDPADRRRHAIVVTALGRRRAEELRAMVVDVNDALLAPLDDRERETFVDVLDRLVAQHRRR